MTEVVAGAGFGPTTGVVSEPRERAQLRDERPQDRVQLPIYARLRPRLLAESLHRGWKNALALPPIAGLTSSSEAHWT